MKKNIKTEEKTYNIGISGTGFIARGLIHALKDYPNLHVSAVLTRRDIATIRNVPVKRELLTNSVDKLIESSDLVVECTGDVLHGTKVVEQVLKANIPVVTMNAELQVTVGTMLARLGRFVEAEGDQPGSLACLDQEVREMGFEPIVYGNMKRFLNLNPNLQEMEYWAKRQGITLQQVTSFTDGTKVQIEQAFVANALGATIACRNLSGIPCKAVEDGALRLGEIADSIGGKPISDYIMNATGPAGVFIVAKHKEAQKPYLEYLKLGPGPYYVLIKPYHLCHLEIPKTILRVLSDDTSYTFNNGQHPTIQVLTIAKRNIAKGEKLDKGIGSFMVRGEAAKIKNYLNAVPIGLIQDVTFVRPVAEGAIVTFDDIELPKSRALEMWQEILEEIKNA